MDPRGSVPEECAAESLGSPRETLWLRAHLSVRLLNRYVSIGKSTGLGHRLGESRSGRAIGDLPVFSSEPEEVPGDDLSRARTDPGDCKESASDQSGCGAVYSVLSTEG